MFFSADDDLDGAPTAGDGVSICMSVLAHEDVLLVERDEDERGERALQLAHHPTKTDSTTQLVECVRKIKSQRLAVQESVIRGLVVRGCLMNFSNQDFGRTSSLNSIDFFSQF